MNTIKIHCTEFSKKVIKIKNSNNYLSKYFFSEFLVFVSIEILSFLLQLVKFVNLHSCQSQVQNISVNHKPQLMLECRARENEPQIGFIYKNCLTIFLVDCSLIWNHYYKQVNISNINHDIQCCVLFPTKHRLQTIKQQMF